METYISLEALGFRKKSKMTDFWSTAIQKKKSKVANEPHLTTSQETTESVTKYDKINQQLTTETPSTTNTPPITSAQGQVKQNINNENDILVGLHWKRELWQLSKSDRKEIT